MREVISSKASFTVLFGDSYVVRYFWHPSMLLSFVILIVSKRFFLNNKEDDHLSTCLPVTMPTTNY